MMIFVRSLQNITVFVMGTQQIMILVSVPKNKKALVRDFQNKMILRVVRGPPKYNGFSARPRKYNYILARSPQNVSVLERGPQNVLLLGRSVLTFYDGPQNIYSFW